MNNDNNTVKSNGVDKAKRQLQGQVVSNKMNKTVVVKVESFKVHPKYHKRYRVSKKYPAHVDEEGFAVGDTVVIEECRPYSKTVNWRVIKKA
ncbi:MAG: 30S ribosomal protein S17 [Candidatus Doudnabacteria bacterium]|nr:30S ribosomal protein S17 [Candidatus Doudnabacteria bacterium]